MNTSVFYPNEDYAISLRLEYLHLEAVTFYFIWLNAEKTADFQSQANC